jgi:DNA uptake protein ComE-like DNA-binding protein
MKPSSQGEVTGKIHEVEGAVKEASMEKTRINLANPQELLEIPGLHRDESDAIVRHRAAHGPIGDAAELRNLLGHETVTPALLEHVDFQPAEATAAEAPGA